jgi:hypothetical protein
MMEAVRISETSVNLFQFTRCCEPEDNHLFILFAMRTSNTTNFRTFQMLCYGDSKRELQIWLKRSWEVGMLHMRFRKLEGTPSWDQAHELSDLSVRY